MLGGRGGGDDDDDDDDGVGDEPHEVCEDGMARWVSPGGCGDGVGLERDLQSCLTGLKSACYIRVRRSEACCV